MPVHQFLIDPGLKGTTPTSFVSLKNIWPNSVQQGEQTRHLCERIKIDLIDNLYHVQQIANQIWSSKEDV